MSGFVVSAPGKVIIFGEHAAVYYKPAIAAALSLRTYLLVLGPDQTEPDRVVLKFPSIQFDHSWKISSLPWNAVTSKGVVPEQLDKEFIKVLEPFLSGISQSFQHIAALTFLYLYLHLCDSSTPSHTFVTKSLLPVGAGLGSSASFCVDLVAALLTMNGLPGPLSENGTAKAIIETAEKNGTGLHEEQLKLINDWAFVGERCMHGNPSGIDNLVATRGGAVMFQRPNAMIPITKLPSISLILTNTKHPRRTAELVAKVGRLRDKLSQISDSILDAIEHITREAYDILTSSESHSSLDGQRQAVDRLAQLVRLNHGLLVAIGVSHPKLEKIKSMADELEIGETKLTGAGGGGCAITLLHSNVQESQQILDQKMETFRQKLEGDEDFEVFESSLGGPGAGIVKLSTKITADEFSSYSRAQLEDLGEWGYWGY